MGISIPDRLRIVAHSVIGLFAPSRYEGIASLFSRYYTVGAPDRSWRGMLDLYEESPEARRYPGIIAATAASVPILIGKPASSKSRRQVQRYMSSATPGARYKSAEMLEAGGDLVAMPHHPIARMLSTNISGVQTGNDLLRLVYEMHLLTGESPVIPGFNGAGAPDHALAIPPTWVLELPTMSRPSYRMTGALAGINLEPDRLLLWRQLTARDPLGRGRGQAQVTAGEVEMAEALSDHSRRAHLAGGPEVILAASGLAKQEDRIRAQWRSTSPISGGLPMTLSATDLKVHQLQRDLRVMQTTEQRKEVREALRFFWGVPPSFEGNFDDNSGLGRSGVELETWVFMTRRILPLVEGFAAQLQILADRYTPGVVVYPSPQLDEDFDRRLEAMKAQASTPKVDEWRAMQGLPLLGGVEGQAHLLAGSVEAFRSLLPGSQPLPPRDDD